MIAWEETTTSDVQQLNIEMNANEKNGYKCQASTAISDRGAWKAFNYGGYNTWQDAWESNAGTGNCNGAWLWYYFQDPVCVTKFEFADPDDNGYGTYSNFWIQGGNSESGPWINIQHFNDIVDGKIHTLELNNENYYLYYRIQMDERNNTNGPNVRISWLKYFGTKKIVKKYEVKKVYYGNNPMKKIVVGDNKVIYAGKSWKYHEGSFINMINDNSPLPFKVSRYEYYGGNSSSSGSYYYAFNNNTGNQLRLDATKRNSNNTAIGIKCDFGKTIRVVEWKVVGWRKASKTGCYLYNGENKVDSHSIAPDKGTSLVTSTFRVSGDYIEADSIRFSCWADVMDYHSYCGVAILNVTKWYEYE